MKFSELLKNSYFIWSLYAGLFIVVLELLILSSYQDILLYVLSLPNDLLQFFSLWIGLGLVLLGLSFYSFKNCSGNSRGKVFLFSGALSLLWIILGFKVLDTSYFGTISDWFSGISFVVLTAYLVQETINQRKAQTEPDLIAENDFNIYFHNCNEFLKGIPDLKATKYANPEYMDNLGIWSKSDAIPKKYHEKILNVISENNKLDGSPIVDLKKGTFDIEKANAFIRSSELPIYHENDIGLKVYNVGMGVAKKIIYQWEYDFDKFFKSLAENKTDLPINQNDFIIESNLGGKEPSIDPNYNLLGEYNLLLPYKSPKDFLTIPLPNKLLNTLGVFCKKYGEAHINLPIFLTVTYYGISNDKTVKKYLLLAKNPGMFSYSGGLCNIKTYDCCKYGFKVIEVTHIPRSDIYSLLTLNNND